MKTLGIDEVAELLHKSPRTVREDLRRRPNAIPPTLRIPGSRTTLWLEETVRDWLKSCESKAVGRPRAY